MVTMTALAETMRLALAVLSGLRGEGREVRGVGGAHGRNGCGMTLLGQSCGERRERIKAASPSTWECRSTGRALPFIGICSPKISLSKSGSDALRLERVLAKVSSAGTKDLLSANRR